ETLLQGLPESDGLRWITRAGVADRYHGGLHRIGVHDVITRAPADSISTIHSSSSIDLCANSLRMACSTKGASAARAQAKVVGPDPEIEQPSAPASIAALRTSWNPGINA